MFLWLSWEMWYYRFCKFWIGLYSFIGELYIFFGNVKYVEYVVGDLVIDEVMRWFCISRVFV